MSGFTASWLALREPADHRSRRDFTAIIAALGMREWTIVDLGCGSGSNLRYVSSRLDSEQQWTCIDHDAELLESLTDRSGCRHEAHCTITPLNTDLSDGVDALIAASFEQAAEHSGRLVTASALLDLVSSAWIESLAAAGTRARVVFWLALSYDGRIELSPGHARDAELRALVNAHQRTDKGFGAALGPHAHRFTADTLTGAGYAVHEAASDWLLGPDEGALMRELLSGWLAAAREQSADAGLLGEWEAQRLEQLAAGTLSVRVGHRDLLAVPDSSA